jgi:type VI secretion system protein ImpF
MSELTLQERLQPALLDRLIDDEPGSRQESRERRVISLARLRDAVLRDLRWLLNADNLGEAVDLEEYPRIAVSALNYGLPPLAGRTVSTMDLGEIARRMRRTIQDFEPRLLRNSVVVRVSTPERGAQHNALSFEIEGMLWAQPMPLELYLKTEVDLESGEVEITESNSAQGAE